MNGTAVGVSSAHRPDSFLERSKYIPLRLTYEERNFLRLLEAALNVSEYTDKVRCSVAIQKTENQGDAGGYFVVEE